MWSWAWPSRADGGADCDEQGAGDVGGACLAEAERDGGEQCAHRHETGEEAHAVGAQAAQCVVLLAGAQDRCRNGASVARTRSAAPQSGSNWAITARC
ncbi:hypothetical protein SGRIM128S_02136 [Streptomyces griseomycini]